MSAKVSELDKVFDASDPDVYGTMTIRVVVLPKPTDSDTPAEDDVPMDLGDEEVQAGSGKTPTRTFLEDPKRGKECCVFLINGQRQEAWDNTFIVRDLDKKYLRNRMLVVVDLDGLKPEAAAELMSGDRQGFFQGTVYHALSTRLISTLRRDPDLERLEEDAERAISELRGGDAAVKQALDQLIDSHHNYADHTNIGANQPGPGTDRGVGAGIVRSQNVVVPPQESGMVATGPYLIGIPIGSVIRVHPSEMSRLQISTVPASAWSETSELQLKVSPSVDGLSIARKRDSKEETLVLTFDEPSDFEDDQYPLETLLTVTAIIKGFAEQRLLERRVVISRPKKRKPMKPPLLTSDPSFLLVTSRQPVPIATLGSDTHVRLRWDGHDALAVGSPPAWTFSAKCLGLQTVAPTSFSRPNGGRFELLIHPMPSLSPEQSVEFEVVASGPSGKKLTARFIGQVMSPLPPKKLKKIVAEPSAQRKPPYELLYVDEDKWDAGYAWTDDERWTAQDVGFFEEPSTSRPLMLIINNDMALLKEYREKLLSKKLEPQTVKERVTRYTSHVAFHLYQMYLSTRILQENSAKEQGTYMPNYDQLRGEINRVGTTLLKVMSVTQ